MMTKFAAALVLSSALMAPSFSSAQDGPSLEEIFPNRGACESTLKRIRNEARQTVKQNGGSGQTNALINRLANPAIKFVCTAVTGQNGSSGFKIVEG
ncbi:MAG: hypothetical protein KY446_12680 [Proteobacteria bacterium]|nr:hypothetical protein [Pseudomonadota bacterium]